MDKLYFSPLDKKDLLELLEYARLYKEMNRPVKKPGRKLSVWDDYTWWCMRIDQLKAIINGRNMDDPLFRSSMPIKDEDGLEDEILNIF